MIDKRKCCKCLVIKDMSFFQFRKSNNTYFYTCKDCENKRRRIKREAVIDNLQGELWKDAFGYEGLYQVSDLGRIKGLERVVMSKNNKPYFVKEYVYSNNLNLEGYLSLSITGHDRIKTTKTVHVIVAKTFIPNPENLPQVNHKNGIKTDNRVENLEWCTPKENSQHALENGLLKIMKGELHGLHKIKEQKVLAIRRLYRIKPNVSISGISKKLNLSVSHVRRIIKNECWKHI